MKFQSSAVGGGRAHSFAREVMPKTKKNAFLYPNAKEAEFPQHQLVRNFISFGHVCCCSLRNLPPQREVEGHCGGKFARAGVKSNLGKFAKFVEGSVWPPS